MQQPVCPVVVSFHTPLWIRIALRSFHEHFPHWRILVVDNNPQSDEPGFDDNVAAERAWLNQQAYVDMVVQPSRSRTHGKGIDRAVAWCREHGIPWMLHLEPDCLISGNEWYRRLCEGIDHGAHMAASHRKQYGPLHVTPSLWAITPTSPSSMDYADRRLDEIHPRFAELFDRPWLLNAVPAETLSFWQTKWDTGQKAWFDLAVHDQATQVGETRDFRHFWSGSLERPREEWFRERPELWHYLTCNYQAPPSILERSASPVAAALRELLLLNLAPYRGQKAALVGVPRHANTGDHLITLGTREALRTAGIDLIDEQGGPCVDVGRCQKADIVFFAGGGNFGDLYRHEMEARLTASEQITKPVVWLSQSIYYRDAQIRTQDAARLARCGHVELWIRDAESLTIATNAFSNRMKLIPDMAFGLSKVQLAADPAGPISRIQRGDAEKVGQQTARGIDWLMPGLSLPHFPEEFWSQAWRCLPSPSQVVTDRLHTHVLCVMADIPNILVSGTHHKMSAFYRTWTHSHPRSQLAASWDDAEQRLAAPSTEGA